MSSQGTLRGSSRKKKPSAYKHTGNTMEDGDNSIFVGDKSFMNYVTAVVMQFTSKEATEVFIKSRGKFISKAVDVAEVAVKRFLKDQIKVTKISIDSESFTNKEGKEVRVSVMEIALKKI